MLTIIIPGLILGLHPANERRRNAVSHWLGTNLEPALLYKLTDALEFRLSCTQWSICFHLFIQMQPCALSLSSTYQ